MHDEDVVEIATQVERAFNITDWDAYSALLANDVVIETPVMQGRGPEDVLHNARRIKDAFPDMTTTITNRLSCGDTAVLELTVEGTHSGPLATPRGPIPPTHRKVAFKTVMLFEISNGKVKALREYFDRAALMAQLGTAAPIATGNLEKPEP